MLVFHERVIERRGCIGSEITKLNSIQTFGNLDPKVGFLFPQTESVLFLSFDRLPFYPSFAFPHTPIDIHQYTQLRISTSSSGSGSSQGQAPPGREFFFSFLFFSFSASIPDGGWRASYLDGNWVGKEIRICRYALRSDCMFHFNQTVGFNRGSRKEGESLFVRCQHRWIRRGYIFLGILLCRQWHTPLLPPPFPCDQETRETREREMGIRSDEFKGNPQRWLERLGTAV